MPVGPYRAAVCLKLRLFNLPEYEGGVNGEALSEREAGMSTGFWQFMGAYWMGIAVTNLLSVNIPFWAAVVLLGIGFILWVHAAERADRAKAEGKPE